MTGPWELRQAARGAVPADSGPTPQSDSGLIDIVVCHFRRSPSRSPLSGGRARPQVLKLAHRDWHAANVNVPFKLNATAGSQPRRADRVSRVGGFLAT